MSDPKTRKEYDDEHERKLKANLHSQQYGWRPPQPEAESEYELAKSPIAKSIYSSGGITERPRYGVDPRFGRQVEVDLSPERMARAWEAYKARWEAEEEYLEQLKERKIVRNSVLKRY